MEWYYYLIFEGKRSGGATWHEVEKEVIDYAWLAASSFGECVYCVGAIGDDVAFWRYQRGRDALLLTPLRFYSGNVVGSEDIWCYNVAVDGESIRKILCFMRDTAPYKAVI